MRLLPVSSGEFQNSMPKVVSVPKAPLMILELSLRHGVPVAVSFTNFRPKEGCKRPSETVTANCALPVIIFAAVCEADAISPCSLRSPSP